MKPRWKKIIAMGMSTAIACSLMSAIAFPQQGTAYAAEPVEMISDADPMPETDEEAVRSEQTANDTSAPSEQVSDDVSVLSEQTEESASGGAESGDPLSRTEDMSEAAADTLQQPDVSEESFINQSDEPVSAPAVTKEETAELPESEASDSNDAMQLEGSVAGSSKITWTNHKLPAVRAITSSSGRSMSYLTAEQSGYMRVMYDEDAVVVEYYDSTFHMTKQGRIPLELSIWGGFYKGSDAYYLVEGQANTDGVDGTEVVRVIKYDFDWNRIGAGRILAQEGWEYEIRYPFDASCVNMTEVGGKLYVVTGREGYVDPQYGQGHQGMMLIRMDETSFQTEIVYGDFWHSFSQYIDTNGSDIYISEQSEGSRCSTLSRFESARTGTDYFNAFSDRFPVLNYGGSHTSAWAIPCYASVDDMAVSATSVLCAGTSIDQSLYDSVSSDTSHNVYITVTPLTNGSEENTTVQWLTNYFGDGKSFYGLNLTKVNDNRFLVTWEEVPYTDPDSSDDSGPALADPHDTLSCGQLHYVFVDGNGRKISKEYTAAAMLSDCKPIISGNKAVFYTSDANILDFYTIDTATGAFDKSVTRVAGESITWDWKNGTLRFSGKGPLDVNTMGRFRSTLSNASGWQSYSSTDNCWKAIRDNVTAIQLDKGITSIPERSFALFQNVTAVSLPNSLKSIGKEAFYSCSSLRDIYIPDSVTEIGEDVFWTGSYWVGSGTHVVYAKIHGSCTSTAIRYAEENNIRYEATHNYGEWKTTKTPTAISTGLRERVCQNCGEKETEELPVLDASSAGSAKWIQSGSRWWYRHADGSYTKNNWESIGGKWYHFDADGWMQTGWQKIDGTWYYFAGSGAMVTGWQKIGGTWYYFAGNGAMVTGWQKIGGTWYYFAGSGAMVTGWQKIGGTWYYFAGSGAMVTGWQKIGTAWYFFDSSGAMAAGRWEGDYYLTASGAMATNQWIGKYYVGADGKWIPNAK